MGIDKYVLDQKDYIIGLRRYFHKNPEVSFNEYKTAEKIEQELEILGIEHRRVGDTGVLGIISGKKEERCSGKRRVIALRADMDALNVTENTSLEFKSVNNGVMHACGHDAHMASLLGAAKILKLREDDLKGDVRLLFQPAEEIGQGAKLFIKEGILEGVDKIFGYHVAPYIKSGQVSLTSGPIAASCDYFKIRVKGKAAHVSTPHLGIDALYIASQIVVSLQSIVSRSTNPIDTVVVGVGKMSAGTIYNGIAGEAVLEGTTRTYSLESREKTNSAVIKLSQDIGRTYGAEVDVEFVNYAFPLVNSKPVVDEMADIAESIVGSNNIIRNMDKRLAADDFADFLAIKEGCFAMVGTGNDRVSGSEVPQHNDRFDIDEEGMIIATNLEVNFVLKNLL